MVPAPSDSMILPEVKALIHTSGADLRIGGARAYYDIGTDPSSTSCARSSVKLSRRSAPPAPTAPRACWPSYCATFT